VRRRKRRGRSIGGRRKRQGKTDEVLAGDLSRDGHVLEGTGTGAGGIDLSREKKVSRNLDRKENEKLTSTAKGPAPSWLTSALPEDKHQSEGEGEWEGE
jgi:hypothetical protein